MPLAVPCAFCHRLPAPSPNDAVNPKTQRFNRVHARDDVLNQDRIELVGAIVWSRDESILVIRHLNEHLNRDLGYVFPSYRKFVSNRIPPEETNDKYLNRVLHAKTGLTNTAKDLAWVDRTVPNRITRYYHVTLAGNQSTRYNKDKSVKWMRIKDLPQHMTAPALLTLMQLLKEGIILIGKGVETLN